MYRHCAKQFYYATGSSHEAGDCSSYGAPLLHRYDIQECFLFAKSNGIVMFSPQEYYKYEDYVQSTNFFGLIDVCSGATRLYTLGK